MIVHIGLFAFAAAYYGAGGGGGGYPSSVTVTIVSLSGAGAGVGGRVAAGTITPKIGAKKASSPKAVMAPQGKEKKVIKGPDAPPVEVELTLRDKEAVRSAGAELSKRDIKRRETVEAQESRQTHGLDVNSKASGLGPALVSMGGGIDGAQGAGGPGPGLPKDGPANKGPAAGMGGGMGPGGSITIIGLDAPKYPRYSRIRGEEGTVIIQVNLRGGGSPESVLVARSSGYARLDRAALKAARGAEFAIPGRVRGRAVLSKRIAFTFKLKEGDTR
ncbi:MAG: energy transducer TonB [Thermodesulfobacteriota bacterium]